MPGEQRYSEEASLTLDSDLAELNRLREFVEAFCDRAALPEDACYHVGLALEELVVNSIRHGRCEPAAGAIRIALRRDDDRLEIEFSDNGMPFDPLSAPAPNLDEDLGRRPIGGLGIHLVRCLIPKIRYARRDGRNYLFLTQGGTDANRHGNSAR